MLSRSWLSFLVLGILFALATRLLRRKSIMLRIPARHESLRSLWAELDRLVQEAQLGERAAHQCRLALDEACVNIIEHAYSDNPDGEIEVAAQSSPGFCMITLTDHGESYDPSQISTPKIGQSLEKTRPGGLGLYFMHTLMDEVRYSPGPDGNNLIMIKRRPAH